MLVALKEERTMVKAYYDRIYASSYLDLDEQGNTFVKIADLWRETKPKMRILDIGCGAGSVSGELVQRGHLVYGLDVMEEAVRRATQRGLIARVYDANQRLPLKDGYFDCVLALDILEHLFDPLAALQEIRRVLTADGYAILSLPLHFDLRQRLRILTGKGIVLYEHLWYDPDTVAWNYCHIRFFTLREVEDFIASGGFRLEHRVYDSKFTKDVHWLGNLFLNRRVVALLTSRFPSLFASGIRVVIRPSIIYGHINPC